MALPTPATTEPATADGEPAVALAGLSRAYGQRVALAGVTLELPRGRTLAVFGANGAGKTTLLRVLATLLRPHAGEVRVLGRPLPQEGWAVRGRVGLLGHEPLLYRDLTARENLAYHAALHGAPRSRVEALLERVGLGRRADDPVRTLSRGMTQRVAICRAVLHEPELLLLDEPLADLDPGAAAAAARPDRARGRARARADLPRRRAGARRGRPRARPARRAPGAARRRRRRRGRRRAGALRMTMPGFAGHWEFGCAELRGRLHNEYRAPEAPPRAAPPRTSAVVLALIRKDLRLELRSREAVPAMLLFSVSTFVLFHFGLDRETLEGDLAAGVLWVTLLFASVLAMNRLFVAERDEGGFDGFLLAPVDRTALFAPRRWCCSASWSSVELVAIPAYAVLLLGPSPCPGAARSARGARARRPRDRDRRDARRGARDPHRRARPDRADHHAPAAAADRHRRRAGDRAIAAGRGRRPAVRDAFCSRSGSTIWSSR